MLNQVDTIIKTAEFIKDKFANEGSGHTKKFAVRRHKYMEDYLEEFYAEWQSER